MCTEPSKPDTQETDSEWDVRNPFRRFHFYSYLKEEFIQSSRKQQENSGTEDRGPFNNRVYTFVTVPPHFESFMGYGLLQCLDQLLVIFTFLPIRCTLTALKLIVHCLRKIYLFPFQTSSGYTNLFSFGSVENRLLYSHEIRDIIRFSLLIICTVLLVQVDTSVAYHEIRTQSVIKIYIFFNLLEVADRLLSAVCQDALDDLMFTASKFRQMCVSRSSAAVVMSSTPDSVADGTVSLVRDLVLQYSFALICLFAHCFLLLCQVTTLNVAFNSQNKSLVTVFISNNFVELKGNVFRKMGKTNLFQIACADVRERFHYGVWLFIVVCRNMTDTGWNWDDLLSMMCDVFYIFLAEIAVDWVKHSFITKFNVIPSNVYKEYTVSIAYDLLLCRQGKNTADYFDLLSRRMGLTPIPLSCLINVMLLQTVRNPNYFWCCLPFVLIVLFPIKILTNMTLLSLAYSSVKQYIKAESAAQATELYPGADEQTEAEPGLADKSPVKIVSAGDENGRVADTKPLNEPVEPTKHSTPMRFLGFDQPTRDEEHFMPMVIRHRRVRSDSNFTNCPTPVPPENRDEEVPVVTSQNGLTFIFDRPPSPQVPPQELFSFNSATDSRGSVVAARDDTPYETVEQEENKHSGVASSHSVLSDSQGSFAEFLQISKSDQGIPTTDDGKNGNRTTERDRLVSTSADETPRIQDNTESRLTNESDQGQIYSSPVVTPCPISGENPDPRLDDIPTDSHPAPSTGTMDANIHQQTLHRCYSIDLGVLSGFSRKLLHTPSESASPRPLNTNPNIAGSAEVTRGSKTEPKFLRRRVRTRTECSDQKLNTHPSQMDHLPAMWERSSRNSVVQPFDATRLRVKQPLSDVDRYSMVEGQIS